MIIKLNNNNLKEIEGSFLSKKMVEEEFKNNPFANFLILKEKEKVIGYLYYSDIYERAEVNQFEVNEIHRNCGNGQILLEYFIKLVEKDITLEVKEDNIPAIKLYEKNGFIKKAIRKGYYNGIDGILMERTK